MAGVFSTLAMSLILVAADAGTTHADEEASLDQEIEQHCPGAVAAQAERQRIFDMRRPSTAITPTRPALQRELLLRAKLDQEARSAALTVDTALVGSSTDPRVDRVQDIDAANLRRLKQIVRQDGFPTAKMVGFNGVDAAWLLTQHADSDHAFQIAMLNVITAPGRKGQVNEQNVALLTDRVLIAQGKPQVYGSQFGMHDGEFKPGPIADAAHVDERRKAHGLGSLAEYTCVLRAVYGIGAPH